MNPDRDVWQAAVLIVKRYGDDHRITDARHQQRRGSRT
jgi:hypothetical protein